MKPMTATELQNLPSILSAPALCELFSLNPQTFRILIHQAKKRGVPLPPRKRFARRFYYDVESFAQWIWEHADALKGTFEMSSEDENE